MTAEQAMDNISVLDLSPLPFQCSLSHVQTVLNGKVEKQSKGLLLSGDVDPFTCTEKSVLLYG